MTLAMLMALSTESRAQREEHGTIVTLNSNVKLKYDIYGAIVKSKKYEADGHRVVYECDVEDGRAIKVSASIVSAPVGIDQVYIYHYFKGGWKDAIKKQTKGEASILYQLANDESKNSQGMETSIAAYGAASGISVKIIWNVIKAPKPTPPPAPEPTEVCDCNVKPENGRRIDSKIRFNDLYGEVSIRPNWEDDDAYEYAEFDTIIYECDRIRTKEESGAILGLSDMTPYHIGPESIVVIHTQDIHVSKIELIFGGLWANVKKMAQGKSIELEMSHCVSGIKGTIVAFEEKDGLSNVYLFAGAVEVKGKKTGKKVMLKAGQMSSTGSAGSISVKEFDIDKVAKRFGISKSEIENHYSNANNSTAVSSASSRYSKKCGIVKYKITEGKQESEMTRWFGGYGKYERRQVKSKTSAEPSLFIVRDKNTYTLNTKEKTGIKASGIELNFRNMSIPVMKDLKLKKRGTGTVLGKKCTIYANSSMQFYIWEGIILKRISSSNGVKSVMEATSVDLRTTLNEALFKVPSGYKIK